MPSRLSSHLLRLVGSPELRPVDAAIVWALSQLVISAGFALTLELSRNAASVIDPHWLELALAVQTRLIVPLWIVFLGVGTAVRRRWPDGLALAHASMQLTILVGLWGAYLTGFYTFWFGATALVGITMIGLALFEIRVIQAGAFSFLLGALAMTLAEQMKLIPYAPLFVGYSVVEGHLATRFLLNTGPFMLFLVSLSLYVMIGATKRLRRATALIRRYVPSQLAEKILSGEHAGTTRPDRRKVTLFFSDVVGFTETADQMEPEDLSVLLNEYLSEMAAIADDFGATVNQFVGDGIMIFFGAPDATTDRDHALRAVRMALAMQQRMAELGQKWFADGIQTPLRIRIGINTGVASVGDFGSEGRTTYSAIGNQTNLTARIQARCEPGRVLISHTTWALVNDQVPCVERGEIEVKGLHYPVRVYEAEVEGPGASVS